MVYRDYVLFLFYSISYLLLIEYDIATYLTIYTMVIINKILICFVGCTHLASTNKIMNWHVFIDFCQYYTPNWHCPWPDHLVDVYHKIIILSITYICLYSKIRISYYTISDSKLLYEQIGWICISIYCISIKI